MEGKKPAALCSRIKDKSCIGALISEGRGAVSDNDEAEVLAEQFAKVHSSSLDSYPLSSSVQRFPAMVGPPWFFKEDIEKILAYWPTSLSVTPTVYTWNCCCTC